MTAPSNRVLMVGFHFPPSALSSGHLRLLAFTRYLPEFGWEPVVLSAKPFAYEQTDPSSVSAIPYGVRVHRALALDTRRHMGFRGRYPSILAQPDRWISWWPGAVLSGLGLMRRYNVRVIWSTYPIMTAHCVAYALNRVTGIPWVADFRDPVASSTAGKDRITVRTQRRWEQRIVTNAARSVFTTLGAASACEERYPVIARERRIVVIPNGYDEEAFAVLPPGNQSPRTPLQFVHAGVLYSTGRNPLPFFEALANLKKAGILSAADVCITLRASGSEALYASYLERLDIADMVRLAPFLPYTDALTEQARADGLLLFQGPQYDRQVPAKLYEYVRLRRPIFALVGEHGDTAAVLAKISNAVTTPLDAIGAIQEAFPRFVSSVRSGTFLNVPTSEIEQYSRRNTTKKFAMLLNQVVGNAP